MALKFKIARLEDVAEAVRGLYKAEGDAFILDAEGVVPKERLDEFRNNNIQLQQQIDKFKGIDPTKHAELLELQRELNEGQLLKAGKLEEVVASRVLTMRASLEGERDTFKTRAEKAESVLQVVFIDNAVRAEGLKLGVAPTAADDLILRARTVFKLQDGNAVPHNMKGEVIYGKDGKSPMSVNDWVTGLKVIAPHLFSGSQGGGANGGNRTSTGDLSKSTAVQKIEAGLSQGLLRDLPQ